MEDLNALRQKVYEHHVRAEDSSPKEADKPGDLDSGTFLRNPHSPKQEWSRN